MTTCHIERRTLGWIATIGAAVTVPLGLSAGVASAAPHNWDAVAECESGGDWTIDTGNGYYGGLQFLPETWKSHGGKGDPSEASRAEQIRIAEKVLQSQGVGAWPDCGQYLTDPVEVPETDEVPETPEVSEVPEVAPSSPVPEVAPSSPEDLTPAEKAAAVKAAAQEALDSARRLAEQNGSGQVLEQRVAASQE
ncbi:MULTISPECIES: transglycosylase family protein [Rhodococcus]|uniref:Transglycosylase family protein n=1 Tax=Rhodococcus oxybenzonivorans TaxID=1990687 RepID=A0AAE4V442_9NOCA|nr:MULTISPECIES: transglycosylase family protein [Rhodococcus]MDV7240821.1 transglycosylase family protein [Rhodococcus oxybenzonivorans]MDV7267419.1 transglycosylase family protein [Rhodococcus oxybenzonivorans]MDV7273094.1 transglycosylase family protein [Rhodococcus oxybenzonivorans]MDV7333168.1 transglycosylase family protein [Rhodococcus oxybenzonivorans]MDV7342334.1 transglycosylase family protein [Rhodococcus oxybenzonivorans]